MPPQIFIRLADVILSLLGLIILSPILLLVFLFSFVFQAGFPLFLQQRFGREEKLFTLIKFRTMRPETGSVGTHEVNPGQVTAWGKLLRKSKIDELPQLWNVLRGEMSLVGPRPLLMEYLARYTPQQARRMEVKPGITGWAQVNGRNALSWEEKFKLDVWYVDHRSFWLDMKILGMTALQVLARKGISAEGCATMPEFLGSGGAKKL